MQLNKKFITSLSQALLSLFVCAGFLLLWGCSADGPGSTTPEGGNQGGESIPQTIYLSIKIETGPLGSMSRAGNTYDDIEDAEDADFVNGSEDEHRIGTSGNFMLFFDENENLMGVTALAIPDEHIDKPDDENVEARYVARLAVKDGQLPKYCMLVANGQKVYDRLDQLTGKADDVINQIWEESDPKKIGFNDEGLFTMSSSVYSGTEYKGLVTIPTDIIQYEGEPEDDTKVLHVHVERMVAKASFKLQSGLSNTFAKDNFKIDYCERFVADGEDMAPDVNKHAYRVVLTGWNMNAFEKGSYIFKNLPNGNYFTGWDDAANFRSYWAIDPWYSRTSYAWQYRKAVDNSLKYYSGGTTPLRNYSFDELNDGTFGKYVYFPENTYDANALGDLDGRTNVIAGSHLIVCAELESDLDGSFKKNDVYRDRKNIFYSSAKDCFWALIRDFDYAMKSQIQLRFQHYDWTSTSGSDGERLTALVTGGNYSLYHNGNKVTYDYIMSLPENTILFIDATIKDGDGQVFPWLEGMTIRDESGNTPAIYTSYKDGVDSNGNPFDNRGNYLRTTDTNDIKSLILEWAGAADHFKDGKMYYAAPLRLIDGVYGAVRNAWYRYTLEDVTGLGTSVDNPTEPIIPNETGTLGTLTMKVEILDWHELESNVPIL